MPDTTTMTKTKTTKKKDTKITTTVTTTVKKDKKADVYTAKVFRCIEKKGCEPVEESANAFAINQEDGTWDFEAGGYVEVNGYWNRVKMSPIEKLAFNEVYKLIP